MVSLGRSHPPTRPYSAVLVTILSGSLASGLVEIAQSFWVEGSEWKPARVLE